MKTEFSAHEVTRTVFPTRALVVLLVIGFADLLMTAVLHANGMVVELNPLMRPLIERSEWLFAFVKGFTLFAAWGVLAWYAKQNLGFVRNTCLVGSVVYVLVWCAWFLSSS